MSKVMYLRFKRRTDGVFAVFVGILVIATAVCIFIDGSAGELAFAATPPIKGIETTENIYSVSVIMDSASLHSVRLVMEACEGYEITPTCFMDLAWIAANRDYAKQIASEYPTGVLISGDFSSMSRSDAMEYMAVLNDRFMSLTGVFPRYVRYDGENSGYLPSVLSSYGQIYISAENELTDSAVQIRAGGITEINPAGEQTVYALAKTVATAVANSLKPISLSDMLYPTGSEVNANGYQVK